MICLLNLTTCAGAANNKEALDSLQDDSVLQDDAAQFAIHRHQIDMQRREEEEPHEAKQPPEACFFPERHPAASADRLNVMLCSSNKYELAWFSDCGHRAYQGCSCS